MRAGTDGDSELLSSTLSSIDAADPEALERLCREHPSIAGHLRRIHEAIHALRASHTETRTEQAPASRLEQIGRFEIVRELGRGGRRRRLPRARHAARPSRRAEGARESARRGLRVSSSVFRREALSISKVQHPSVVPLYEAGEANGMAYLAMEYVPGIPLDVLLSSIDGDRSLLTWPAIRALIQEWLALEDADTHLAATEPEDPPRSYLDAVVRIVRQVASALHQSHESGIVPPRRQAVEHPRDARLSRADWSTSAWRTRTRPRSRSRAPASSSARRSTARPSRSRPKRMVIDKRTDVYSLGATLYELLTLARPVRGDSVQEIFHQILTKEPRRPRKLDPGLPARPRDDLPEGAREGPGCALSDGRGLRRRPAGVQRDPANCGEAGGGS